MRVRALVSERESPKNFEIERIFCMLEHHE